MRGAWLIVSAVVALMVMVGDGGVATPAVRGAEATGVLAAPVLASAEPSHKETKERGPFDPALDLTLWTIVVFVLMLIILWRFAWGPILQALQGREKAIADAIESAKKDRDEAARMRDQLQKELNQMAEKVRGMLDEGRRDVQHQHDEMVAKARAEIQTEKERLRREIDMARDQALQDIWNRSAELAASLSSKALRRTLSPDDHRRLVDEALVDLGQASEEWRRRGGRGRPA